jgi:hypothetical protein
VQPVTTRGQFAYLLNLVGRQRSYLTPNTQIVAGQLGWMQKEHAADDPHPQATYNPFNTTLWMPGAWPFNTIGRDLHVWNYPNWPTGVDAYWATLLNGRYPKIAEVYRKSLECACVLSAHPDIDIWGTGDFVAEIPVSTAAYQAALQSPGGHL